MWQGCIQKVEENCLTEWKDFLDKFDPNDEDVGSSDYEGQAYLRDDIKNKLKDMHDKVIAYDQLKAFSLSDWSIELVIMVM